MAGIIPATAKRVKNGEKPVINGDGEQTRDFIYVKDTVKGLVLAYENENSRGEIINLGSGRDMTMNSLLKGICEYMGYAGEWEHREDRTSDVRKLCASIDKAKTLLGFQPATGFEKGIKETLDWYIQNGKI